MGADRAAVQGLLAGMRAEYARALPERLAHVETLWRQVVDDGGDCCDELLRTAHTMAGAAATFGLPEVGRAALDLELALRCVCERGGRPDIAEHAAIEERIAVLVALSESPA